MYITRFYVALLRPMLVCHWVLATHLDFLYPLREFHIYTFGWDPQLLSPFQRSVWCVFSQAMTGHLNTKTIANTFRAAALGNTAPSHWWYKNLKQILYLNDETSKIEARSLRVWVPRGRGVPQLLSNFRPGCMDVSSESVALGSVNFQYKLCQQFFFTKLHNALSEGLLQAEAMEHFAGDNDHGNHEF